MLTDLFDQDASDLTLWDYSTIYGLMTAIDNGHNSHTKPLRYERSYDTMLSYAARIAN